MNNLQITVPRENVNNEGVCKDVEGFILDIISKHPEDTFHTKDLSRAVAKKLGKKYGEIGYHVVRALDQFLANKLIKRVAPSTFQDVNGPDEVYSERASGHVPDGQPYEPRPGNYTQNPTVPSARKRANFNAELRKVEASVKILQRCNMTLEQIQAKMLEAGNFNPVAIKFHIKQLGQMAEA